MKVQRLLGHISLLSLILVVGCQQQKPVITAISIDVEKTSEGQFLVIFPQDRASYQEVNVEISVYQDDGAVIPIKKYFAYWEEAKKLPLAKNVRVEKVQLQGTAVRVVKNQGQPVDLRAEVRFR